MPTWRWPTGRRRRRPTSPARSCSAGAASGKEVSSPTRLDGEDAAEEARRTCAASRSASTFIVLASRLNPPASGAYGSAMANVSSWSPNSLTLVAASRRFFETLSSTLLASLNVVSRRDMLTLAAVSGSSSSPGRRDAREKMDGADDFLRARGVYCRGSRRESASECEWIEERRRRGTHAKVALDEAPRLVVADDGRVAREADDPSLERRLDEPVVLVVGRCRRLADREGGHDRLRAGDGEGGDERGELGVRARDGAVCSRRSTSVDVRG